MTLTQEYMLVPNAWCISPEIFTQNSLESLHGIQSEKQIWREWKCLEVIGTARFQVQATRKDRATPIVALYSCGDQSISACTNSLEQQKATPASTTVRQEQDKNNYLH